MTELLRWLSGPFGYLIVILFGIELLVPRLWILLEQGWWRLTLGTSMTSQSLRRYAMKDFQLSIKQREIDSSIPRPLAVLLAIGSRVFELRSMTLELRGIKSEMIEEIFKTTVENLNDGWRKGKPPEILQNYIKIIESSADDRSLDKFMCHWGKSSIAVVKYALGELEEGNRLGKENWKTAKELETEDASEQKWLASYGYFNSTMFLGRFQEAMEMMANQWNRYYAPLSSDQKQKLRNDVSNKLILNPILAVPRHIILAAAFNETPLFEPKYWPGREVYECLASDEDRNCKIKWVDAWYKEAQEICQIEVTSIDFSHAYTGFYFTLLLLEPNRPTEYLHGRIKEAFNAIKDTSPIVSRYAKYGFQGVYHLACGEDEQALDNLSQASSLSAISGNRFADCIFMCSHAVAAARLDQQGRFLKPDIDYYLDAADDLASKINGRFYYKLCAGARAAVYHLQGEEGKSLRLKEKSKLGPSGDRILKIFQNDIQEIQSRKDARELESKKVIQKPESEKDEKEPR